MLAHASFVLCYMCVTSNEPDYAHDYANFGVIPRGLIPHTDCLQGDAEEPQAAMDANGPDSGLALGGMTVTGNWHDRHWPNWSRYTCPTHRVSPYEIHFF